MIEKLKFENYISISLIILFLSFPFNNTQAIDTFPDVNQYHKNYKAISYLHDNNIINGYSDGYFQPDNLVSRIELLKIVMNASNASTNFDSRFTFPDVDSTMWYAKYVSTAYKNGNINGNNGRFYPNNTVTKAESLKIIFNINNIQKATNLDDHVFRDVNQNSWYAPYFWVAKNKKLIDPPYDDKIRPHNPMSRGEIAEIVYRVLIDNIEVEEVKKSPPPIQQDQDDSKHDDGDQYTAPTNNIVYTGDGVYNIQIGDSIIDPSTEYKMIFTEKNLLQNEGIELRYKVYESNGKEKWIANDYIREGMLATKRYDDQTIELHPTLMNHEPDNAYELHFLKKIDENTFKLSIKFGMRLVDEKAKGVKKILFLPIYLSDQSSLTPDHDLRLQYIIKPALDEIKAYIKTKQLQYIGEEVMWFDFTIADYIIPPKPDEYYYENRNYMQRRFELVKNSTPYDPEDFDIIFFRIYTTNSDYTGYSAAYHQAQAASPAGSVTNLDINHTGIMHGQRAVITDPGLHEILHNLGMTDLGKNQGKNECFIGDIYNETLELSNEFCTQSKIYGGKKIGRFQHIDDFVANEIGWTDRNYNGVLDVDEYGMTCGDARISKDYKFCD